LGAQFLRSSGLIKEMRVATHNQQRLAKLCITLAVILTALGLRLTRLPFLTMWSDEYLSFRISSQSLIDILSGNYTGDLNPPLYFAVLHLQRLMFGDSEIAMRSLSLFFAMLSLPIFLILAKSILKAFIPSIGALILMVFHPMMIYYSVEIRSYSLLVFLSLLSFLSCAKIYNDSKHSQRWAILLTFSLSGCLYTHYFGVIVPLSIFVFITSITFISKLWSKRETLSLLSISISGILYLPGLLMLRKQVLSYPPQTDLPSWIQSLQVFVFSINHPQYEQLLAIIAIITLALGVTVLIIQIRIKPIILLVLEGIVTAVVFTMLLSLAGINTTRRYLIVALPLVLITMAATLTRRKWAWNRGINIIGALTIAFYAVYGTNFVLNTKVENQQANWKVDWKQLSDVVKNIRLDGEPIVIMGWDATSLQYYLGETTMTSFELEKQSLQYLHPSYLIVMTPNSRTVPIIVLADLLYEDREKGIKILRWYAPTGK
jgi:uncharacterized membrane protein